MAREFGRIVVTIWADPEFVGLHSRTQRVFFLLVTQAGVTTCGVQPYVPRRWAKLAPDVSLRQVEAAVVELEEAGFVQVDRETEELLLRSFVRHDRPLRTVNVAKSLARTWNLVASPALKQSILAEVQRLFDEEGGNGWPGWNVAEIKAMLAAPVLLPKGRQSERRFG